MAEENNNPQRPAGLIDNLPVPSLEYVREAEMKALHFMNPKRWQMMEIMAKAWIPSGALPSTINNAAKLMMVFQAGFETGLQPVESINSFYFVNGKISMYGDVVIAQVAKMGHKIEWGKCDNESATVKITRKDNGTSFEQTLTMVEASKRRLDQSFDKDSKAWVKKDVWEKSPGAMLRYRVFGTTARFIVPDALHGIPIKEELEGIEEATVLSVETVEGKKQEPIPDTAEKQKTDQPPAAQPSTLQDALAKPLPRKTETAGPSGTGQDKNPKNQEPNPNGGKEFRPSTNGKK